MNKTQCSLILKQTIHLMTIVLLITLTALRLRRNASNIYILDIKHNLIYLTEKNRWLLLTLKRITGNSPASLRNRLINNPLTNLHLL